MKITISQKNKKILIMFKSGKLAAHKAGGPRPEKSGRVDNYVIDKADEFINVVDKFFRKRKMKIESLRKAGLKFVNTGILTERVARSIMLGLSF